MMTDERYCIICGCELCEGNELDSEYVQDLRHKEELEGERSLTSTEQAALRYDFCHDCYYSDAW